MAYASSTHYHGLADARTTPLYSYLGYPSPRDTSDGRYATNIRIIPPFGEDVSDASQPLTSSSTFSYASPPLYCKPPSTYRAANDEFFKTDDNTFNRIVHGSQVHFAGNAPTSLLSENGSQGRNLMCLKIKD